MFDFKDKLGRFLHLQEEKLESAESEIKDDLTRLIGSPDDCLIFHRPNGIDDMESEDDEIYVFCTPDQLVMETFNRFQAPEVLKRLDFSQDKIDLLFRMIWNYNSLIINKKTKEFEVYSGFSPSPLSIIDLSSAGTFTRKTVFID
jgi:hypothetical protein